MQDLQAEVSEPKKEEEEDNYGGKMGCLFILAMLSIWLGYYAFKGLESHHFFLAWGYTLPKIEAVRFENEKMVPLSLSNCTGYFWNESITCIASAGFNGIDTIAFSAYRFSKSDTVKLRTGYAETPRLYSWERGVIKMQFEDSRDVDSLWLVAY